MLTFSFITKLIREIQWRRIDIHNFYNDPTFVKVNMKLSPAAGQSTTYPSTIFTFENKKIIFRLRSSQCYT